MKPSTRREMALKAVEQNQISIRTTCVAFSISETCCRYLVRLSSENKTIADWLIRLTNNQRNWCFGLCFLYLWTYNHERPNTAIGGITPKLMLALAA